MGIFDPGLDQGFFGPEARHQDQIGRLQDPLGFALKGVKTIGILLKDNGPRDRFRYKARSRRL
jgi:hypothetical protein